MNEPRSPESPSEEVFDVPQYSERIDKSVSRPLHNPQETRDKKEPAHIGAYEVVRTLSSSENAEVFLIKLGDDKGRGVLKVETEGSEHDIGEEIALLKRFESDDEETNIPRVIDTGVTPKRAEGQPRNKRYFVTDYYNGSIEEELKMKGKYTVETAADISLQIANALDRMHRAGVVHKDVNKTNILIKDRFDMRPEIVLTDFALAGPPGQLVLASPNYAAPEQFKHEVTYASDVYSLGLLLYELETGERLFKHDINKPEEITKMRLNLQSDQDTYDRFMYAKLDKVRKISAESAALLQNMLDLDPQKRPNITTVKEKLQHIYTIQH